MPSPYPLPDVIGVEVYRSDVIVLREGYKRDSVAWTRGDVIEFSKASRQRLAFVASNTEVEFTAMVTLTYPKAFPSDGEIVKRHFKAFREALRRRQADVQYLWFIEFQKRGAPHFHLLLRGMRVSRKNQIWLSKTWYRICDTGDPKHLRAGTRLERIRKRNGARHYAVKYAMKMQQKRVPRGYRSIGRFWGYTKGVAPRPRQVARCTNDDLVECLQYGGWPYQNDDTIHYHTLYRAAKHLRSWLSDAIIELSSINKVDDSHNQKMEG